MWDGQIKVITGIRRCGKSYLLRTIFKRYLLEQGVAEDHILSYELDLAKDIKYRDPLELAKTVRERVEGRPDRYYLFVDEIQMSDDVPNPYNPDGKKIRVHKINKPEKPKAHAMRFTEIPRITDPIWHTSQGVFYDRMYVPIREKANLTVKEAVAYSGIGEHAIRELLEDSETHFVFQIGKKWLINRKLFDQFIAEACQQD